METKLIEFRIERLQHRVRVAAQEAAAAIECGALKLAQRHQTVVANIHAEIARLLTALV